MDYAVECVATKVVISVCESVEGVVEKYDDRKVEGKHVK